MIYNIIENNSMFNLHQERFGGHPKLRMAKAKAGPVVTDNGNFILDWEFELDEIRRNLNRCMEHEAAGNACQIWRKVNSELCCIAGVVETGIFANMAKIAYFGNRDGTVSVVKKM